MQQEEYRGFDIQRDDFADNPDPRVPCVMLLDASYSMSGNPISQLNDGLIQYRDELLLDNMAARRVEVAVFRFGGQVSLEHDFVTANQFIPPTLEAGGGTPMAEAVMRGIHSIEDRKSTYQANGIPYYRPWIFLLTDGEPTDNEAAWRTACEAVRRGEEEKKFSLFAVGAGEANFSKLREISPARSPLKLRGIAFKEMFRWLSNSQTSMSHSQVGENIALPPATGDDGWAEVPT